MAFQIMAWNDFDDETPIYKALVYTKLDLRNIMRKISEMPFAHVDIINTKEWKGFLDQEFQETLKEK